MVVIIIKIYNDSGTTTDNTHNDYDNDHGDENYDHDDTGRITCRRNTR